MGSSGSSTTAQRLRRSLPKQEVISPDIPVQPEPAMAELRRLAAQLDPDDIIVGTSMGGMYAQLFKGWRRILINPSFHTSRHLKEKIGIRQPFHNPRKDGARDYEVSDKLCRKFEALEKKQFDPKFGILGKRPDRPEYVTGFFGTRDMTVNCKDEFLEHFTNAIPFDGEHRLDPDTTLKLIVPKILELIAEESK